MNVQSLANRRSENRSRVFMTGTLVLPEGACQVRIRDISSKGARLVVDGEVPVDCDAILKRRPLFAAGRVTWSKQREAGFAFYRPLTEVELDLAFKLLRREEQPAAATETA